MREFQAILAQGLKGRYQVESEVGRGGMATVYRAEDLKHERTVAIKVLLPELASVLGSERFLREIQIAANLRHPHILPLLDSGEVEGLPFYVMPYVEGESVREKLTREKQLPIEETISIGREVADALSYAHSKGIVHRDIKPANIMLDSGHAVVADFGIALPPPEATENRLTASGLSPGSPEYMSPEQAAGEEDVDGRSDIYSLGCVLYESLAGDPPFTGRLPQAILAKKLRESPPDLRVVRDSVPDALNAVVMKALSRSRADRFKNAREFGEALRTTAESRSTGSPIGPVADRSRTAPIFRSLGGWSRILIFSALVFTIVGGLTNFAYDVKLLIPGEFTPSRWDWPILGFRASLPVLIFGLGASIVFWFLGSTWRLLSTGLQRVPGVGNTYSSLKTSATGMWRGLWTPLASRTVAEVFFFFAILAGIAAIAPFNDYLRAIFWTEEMEILHPASRSFRERYNLVLAPLIVALLLSWRAVFSYLGKRGPLAGRVALARWGSLAWIGVLLIMATLPWQLVHHNTHERTELGGQRAYILIETDTELVVYRPETGVSAIHRKGTEPGLERFGTDGYVFEGQENFDAATRPDRGGG